MRVLFDECVPRQLRKDLSGFDIELVKERGWTGVKNGELIDLASDDFDVIFTVDRDFGTAYRGPLPLGVVIIEIGTTDPIRLRPYMPAVADALRIIRPGQVTRIGA